MADKPASDTASAPKKDKGMDAFIQSMKAVVGTSNPTEDSQLTTPTGTKPPVSDGRGQAHGPDMAQAITSFANQQKKFQQESQQADEERDRKTEDWRKSVLDLLSANTARTEGRTGGSGGFSGTGLLKSLGSLVASIIGPTGAIKAFKTLGRVIGSVYKGGKLFLRVMGKAGSVLVSFTAALGKAGASIGKMVTKAVSSTLKKGMSTARSILGFGRSGVSGGANFVSRTLSATGRGLSRVGGGVSRSLGSLGRLGSGAGKAAASVISRGAGRAVPIVGAALSGADLLSQLKDNYQQKHDSKGAGWKGIGSSALSGGMLGASVGSVIPGVGTAIGGGIGAAVGGGASAILQHKEAIEKYLSKVWGDTKKAFGSISTFLGHVWNGSREAWGRIILPRLESMGKTLEESWRKAKPALSKVGSVISTIGEGVQQAFSKVFGVISTVVRGAMRTVGPLLKWGGKFISDKLGISASDLKAVESAFSSPVSSTEANDTVQGPVTLHRAASPSTPARLDQSAPAQQENPINDNHPRAASPSTPSRMSLSPNSTGSTGPTRAGTTGFDEDKYLSVLAGAESGGKVDARNPTSSATGLWQLTRGTVRGLNKNYGTHFTLEDMKDPRKAYQAEKLLLNEERRGLGEDANDPEKLAAMHVLGASSYRKWVRGNVNWKADLSRRARAGDGSARDALRDVRLLGGGYYTPTSRNAVDVASLRNGGMALAKATPADAAETRFSDQTNRHLANISNTLDRQMKMAQNNHEQTMKVAANQNRGGGGDGRGFNWETIPVSAVPHDIASLLAKPT